MIDAGIVVDVISLLLILSNDRLSADHSYVNILCFPPHY